MRTKLLTLIKMLDSGEEYKTNLENVIVDWVINLNRKSHKELPGSSLVAHLLGSRVGPRARLAHRTASG